MPPLPNILNFHMNFTKTSFWHLNDLAFLCTASFIIKHTQMVPTKYKLCNYNYILRM